MAANLAACAPEQAATSDTKVHAVAAGDVLRWQGDYRGRLPCADCSHIELHITLYPDLRYRMSTLRVGHVQAPPQVARGRFVWREDGLIELDQNGDHMVFFIGTDGRLEMRGNDGTAHPNHRGEICRLDKIPDTPR
ncbi:MAG: copper resistance protein NlpE N-terminal domain-containing protein [Neisseria sp.]|nr:copper resistance protein NlpE N-terminal domain-containing protein [Neisseria sp.]